ncbi:MAG TPA: type II CAAX endopeptidase family protein [Draconibacterium sp.]|nr:type II CAAX endopeptidase family protein [Draconibacterium sp.]HRX12036.1 type II CAAX endopeptidase family protein [Draconibacterium sp.]
MNELSKKYYPTILQAIHLLILYIFIQSLVDFPLAMIDYFKDTEYLYHPIKKIGLGVGSTVFILIYGFKKSKAQLFDVFPVKFFNLLIIVPIITFLWAAHNLLEIPSALLDKYLPAPAWFWEMFNKIFEGDFGWWGAFMKVAVVAPIVEELIFRGLILQGFRRNYNAFTAVFMSALLFALFHLNPWQFPATFVLGLLLGWIMLRTNNILLAILGHSINNFLVLLSLTYWQEIRSHAFYLMGKEKVYLTSILVVLLSLILIFLFSSKLIKNKNIPVK